MAVKPSETRKPQAGPCGLTCGFACGQGRGRTADLPLFRRTLVPTELPAQARRNSTTTPAPSSNRSHSPPIVRDVLVAPGPRKQQVRHGLSGGGVSGSGLEHDLVVAEPREPVVPRVLAGATEVHHQQALEVAAGEEL